MKHTEKGPDLYDRLRALERLEVPEKYRLMADAYGQRFTPQCIQPHELAASAVFSELPTDRQEHVRSCDLCALVIGGDNCVAPPVTPSREYVVAAAAAAAPPSGLWWKVSAAAIALTATGFVAFRKLKPLVPDR